MDTVSLLVGGGLAGIVISLGGTFLDFVLGRRSVRQIRSVEQLDGLRDRLGAASRAEVIRRALNLLDVATTGGGDVVLRGIDGTERVLVVL